jgi:hypothetical protein
VSISAARSCDYAGDIFLCPAAAVKSSWKNRFIPDISNRLRHTWQLTAFLRAFLTGGNRDSGDRTAASFPLWPAVPEPELFRLPPQLASFYYFAIYCFLAHIRRRKIRGRLEFVGSSGFPRIQDDHE